MKGVAAVDGIEYVECDEAFEERFEDIIGITWIKEEDLREIILAVKDSYMGYIDTKPLHGPQIKFPVDKQVELHNKYSSFEGYTFYSLNVKPNRELFNTVYRNGENVILISPATIREQMILEMTATLERIKEARDL